MARSNAILYRMDSGIPGDVSRKQSSLVEAAPMNPAAAFSAYGMAAKIVSGKVVPFTGGETMADLWGIYVRPFPTMGTDAAALTPPLASAGFGNFMRSGYMTVANDAGTPAFGGQVYIRIGNASTGKPIGGFEAAAEQTQAMVAAGGNTGNGVSSALSSTAAADIGAYAVTFTGATTFTVVNPTGRRLKDGVTGSAYSSLAGIGFTITAGGTAFVSGDSFTFTVTRNTLLVTNSQFKSAADASGNVEIEYNVKGA